jgi:hypothetical protein
MKDHKKGRLPRLPPEFYQGHAWVFWTHTFENRATGWLDPGFHSWFREVQLHALCREALACPLYVLMPDHVHCLWIGLHQSSDQRPAISFLRRAVNKRVSPVRLQPQPHDHVLRSKERDAGAFSDSWDYIAQNPERASLVDDWKAYLFLGSSVPGYPDLDPRQDDYWCRWWTILSAAQARWCGI